MCIGGSKEIVEVLEIRVHGVRKKPRQMERIGSLKAKALSLK